MDSKEYIALNELYNSLVFGLFSEIENQIFFKHGLSRASV